MSTIDQLLVLLEDTSNLMKKTQTNLRKSPKARLTKGYLQARMQCIDEYWRTFTTTHQELIKITPRERRNDYAYFLNDEYCLNEDLYLCIKGDIQDAITVLQTPQPSQSPQSQGFSNSVEVTDNRASQVRLPRIELPTYSGRYEEWPTFQDLFVSLVHNNTSLSDVQKLHYLKCSVAGEAEVLLRHICVTDSNYIQAWETLKQRYGNKRIIVNSLLNRLFSHKRVSIQSANHLKMLLDNTTECISTLNNLNVNTDSWSPLIIFLTVQKLDQESRKDWETFSYKSNTDDLPSWADLKGFLESKFRTLELVNPVNTMLIERTKEKSNQKRSFHITSPPEKSCLLCNEKHSLCHCKQFAKMSVIERNNYVKSKNLCFNCMSTGHSALKCRLPMTCRICRRRHHTLLHSTRSEEAVAHTSVANIQPQSSNTNVEENEVQANAMMTSHFSANRGYALLATAVVKVRSETGHSIILRALIDQGSQASFISERAAQLLKLKKKSIQGNIVGVGSTKTRINSVVQLYIHSTFNTQFCLSTEAFVISKQVTTKLPSKSIITRDWPHLTGLQLADPAYNKPGHIDLLLGVQEYAKIIQQDIVKGPAGTPCAQKTELGWILFGHIGDSEQGAPSLLVMHHQIDLDSMLRSMWELESDKDRKFTQEERRCEEIYENTYKRNEEGRFIVNLPFKTENQLSPEGNSKEIALKRFLQLEKRFEKMPKLRENYTKVIEEYVNLGHAEEIPREEYDKRAVYLCHHAVVRDDSESTPTRVVFDASCKGTNGISLNDELLVGPQLQEDLRNIIMRWRMHAICFVSDIIKMYRMVLVARKHVDFQRILWRKDTDEEIKEYRLLTVTFGTAPAPYLAVKTLRQLAEDEGSKFPVASKITKEDFYVDDVLSGYDTVEEAIAASKELIKVLKRGGFELQKWSSNSAAFMRSIEPEKRSTRVQLNLKIDGTIKTLGILWNLSTDVFNYNLNLPAVPKRITKRSILSDVQKLFDPLGWIAPCIVTAKILIQKLWLARVDWDEEVDVNLSEEWLNIRKDFESVKEISIDRWIRTSNKNVDVTELHGFCDASEKAYAAVVYGRILNSEGKVITKILAARTRVAPVKSVSLPRLELCGAVLLAKLLTNVAQAMRIPESRIFAWTDSTIVLSWLCGEPWRWKQFVANRVVEILDNISNNQWHHVSSEHNPADIASRGALISNLKGCNLWWDGPEWLKNNEINFIKPNNIFTELERRNIQVNLKVEEDGIIKLEEFNNLNELLTVIVLSLRFLRSKINPDQIDKPITTYELETALKKCIKIAQRDFYEDIEQLKNNKHLKTNSKIKTLNPYLDGDGILRVGGRLRHSLLPEHSKHPIILEGKNELTYLLIADAHKKTLHGGIQLVLTYLRSKYWILKAKNTVKAYIHKCIICARQKAVVKTQMMGDLPYARTTPARPFLHSGIDFAGPLHVLMSKGRGAKQYKAYIAIFVCMATKAIHLELVGDLTSQSFVGAFRRFVARRGRCTHLYSDQGRNFVGANKELAQAFQEAQLELPGHLIEILSSEGTQWHFIPPYSPNFGGLWEAGVKSIKYHLRRILTGSLTFEEMTTTLCEIEACLNSRPLTPVDTSDPDSPEPLTPGHFLIGEAPVNIPTPDLRSVNINRLDRWQITQKLVRDFWHRWQTEYLSRLQTRPKWLKQQSEFNIGDIVLIKDEQLPPGKWSLGRIVAKHPGKDGFTRVYSVKYRNDIVKRSLSKLCELPVNDVHT